MTIVDKSRAVYLLRQACAEDVIHYLSGVCDEEYLFQITRGETHLREQHAKMIKLLGDTYHFLDEILMHLAGYMGYPAQLDQWTDAEPVEAMEIIIPNLSKSQWKRLKLEEIFSL
ncbi:hypothetical protein LGV61_02710 [Desulfurispirillum indicum]|uniref:Uncharacterized protein n=1 Tax=Desulfurispirillum indicum (strain ATCC BAA-1389 / DSM 22839 / S5) TaxID=653733 RepID=E6W0Y0_DESIS|nr:hypothetical protein [Desulfurispirillum indicum]ADU65312.1 hypothetical protein Selin_0564 [Desulfurispirillum indicum S5]UCZ57208.1 hypothetical protein LGV61_02710 [Desulfurispirillum indicum]